jgi:hypothetical protein
MFPRSDEVLEALDQSLDLLAAEDRSGWSSQAKSARLLELVERVDGLKAQLTRALGEWDAGRSWEADGALSAPSWFAAHAQVSKREARQAVRAARLAHLNERVGKALAAGDLSSAHVDVLANATRGRTALLARDVDVLVDLASTLSVDGYTTAMKHWRSLADDEMARVDAHVAFEERTVSWTTTFDGRLELWASLDAEGGATVARALEAYDRPDAASPDGGPADGPRTVAQRLADGLVQMCSESLHEHERAGHHTPGIEGLIDIDRLSGRAAAHTVSVEAGPGELADWLRSRCELRGVGPVAREALLRLACDAAVGRVVMRGRSEVLDVGRRTRVVGRALHRAIELRDGRCVFPGCDAPLHWCDVHHLVHGANGGETNLDNCVLLCRRHHVLCHEGGGRLARGPDGRFEIAVRGGRPRKRRRGRPPDRAGGPGGYDLAA